MDNKDIYININNNTNTGQKYTSSDIINQQSLINLQTNIEQEGGAGLVTGLVTSIAGSVTSKLTDVTYINCTSKNISEYLSVSKNISEYLSVSNETILESDITTLYDYFIKYNESNKSNAQTIGKKINKVLKLLKQFNQNMINYIEKNNTTYLLLNSELEKLKKELSNFSIIIINSNKDTFITQYNILCYLSQLYYEYIKKITPEIQKIAKMLHLPNYLNDKSDQSITYKPTLEKEIKSIALFNPNASALFNPNASPILLETLNNFKYLLNDIDPSIKYDSKNGFELFEFLSSNKYFPIIYSEQSSDTWYKTMFDQKIKPYLDQVEQIFKINKIKFTPPILDNFRNVLESNKDIDKFKFYFPQIWDLLTAVDDTNKGFCLYSYAIYYSQPIKLQELEKYIQTFKICSTYDSSLDIGDILPKLRKSEDITGYYSDNLKSVMRVINTLDLNLIVSNPKSLLITYPIYFDNDQLNEQVKYYYYYNETNLSTPVGNMNIDIGKVPIQYIYYPNIDDRFGHFIKFLVETCSSQDAVNKFLQFVDLWNNYVNAYRVTTKKITDARQLLFKLYLLKVTQDDIRNIRDYIKYNNSLNNTNKDNIINPDDIKIDYETIYDLVLSINKIYFVDTETELLKDLSIQKLFTDQIIEEEQIDKKLLDICLLNSIKYKKLSGIKIIIKIIDCKQVKETQSKTDYTKIHLYLTKNLSDKKEIRHIKLKKISDILDKLEIGTCTDLQIKILQKVYERKLIKDQILDTNIKSLLTLADKVDTQKYIYNLLNTISPMLQLDFKVLFINFVKKIIDDENAKNDKKKSGYLWQGINYLTNIDYYLTSAITIYSNLIDNTKQSIRNFIEFIKNEYNKIVIKVKNVETIIFYLYLNFDYMIISIETLDKIITSLKKSDNYNETDTKNFNILHFIIEKHVTQLKLIGKKIPKKLEYFMTNKWDQIKSFNPDIINLLFKILYKISDQNVILLNTLDYLKENIFSKEITEEIDPQEISNIIDIFLLYSTNSTYDTYIKLKQLEPFLKQLKDGDCTKEETIRIVEIIKTFDKSFDTITLFLNTYKDENNYEDYAVQQELYDILLQLSKHSTLINVVVETVVETAKDNILETINNQVQLLLLQKGYTETPAEMVEKITKITKIATQTVKVVGTIAATTIAYKSIDYLFNKTNDKINKNTSSVYIYKKNQFIDALKTFIASFGIGLTFQTVTTMMPDITDILSKYIDLNFLNFNLKTPVTIDKILIGSLITTGIKTYFTQKKGGERYFTSPNLFGGANNQLEPSSTSFNIPNIDLDTLSNINNNLNDNDPSLLKMLRWLFDQIDHYFGFNDKITEVSDKNKLIPKSKSFVNVYSHLQQNFYYDPYNIFKGIEINEHPDQIKIIERLKRKYNDFIKLMANQSINLVKKDRTKIKKMIAEIINLEINMFKGSNQYTFIYALKQFFNE